jgi:hypothetical protein
MNLQELSSYLQRECYNPNVYHVGPGWGACGDTFCIERVDGQFEVFYVERGQRGGLIHCAESEAEACAAFLAALDRERFSRAHCVGIFTTKSEADRLSDRLVSSGIAVHRDAVPYSHRTDIRHRVFVFGRDKLRAQEMIDPEIRFSAF